MKNKQSVVSVGSVSLGVLVWLCCAFNVHAEAVVSPAEPKSSAPPSLLQCTPVTPATKVPWIEVSQLPDFTNAYAYFEACSDLDYAWTTQSYPNPRYVPERTPEHQARVKLLMQGIKDYVVAESDDWVSYVNAWLGIVLPRPKVERLQTPDGYASIHSISYARDQTLLKFETSGKLISTYGIRRVSAQGVTVFSRRELSMTDLDTKGLCVTPIDLQLAFENQPGYLLRPMSVRTWRNRPNKEELTKLGGQWFGYEVHVFSAPGAAQSSGSIRVAFAFKPCATRIQIELSNTP
jgi:hypothetical protein